MEQVFNVHGMTCGHCERAVMQAIRQLDPRAEIVIDRPAGRVQVRSEQARANIAQAIAQQGYEVAA